MNMDEGRMLAWVYGPVNTFSELNIYEIRGFISFSLKGFSPIYITKDTDPRIQQGYNYEAGEGEKIPIWPTAITYLCELEVDGLGYKVRKVHDVLFFLHPRPYLKQIVRGSLKHLWYWWNNY